MFNGIQASKKYVSMIKEYMITEADSAEIHGNVIYINSKKRKEIYPLYRVESITLNDSGVGGHIALTWINHPGIDVSGRIRWKYEQND